jgi:hypothetical protein
MFRQKAQELLLKGRLAVVLLLTLDVRNGHIVLRNADAERAIAFLPGERPMLREGVMNPFSRIRP